MYERIMNWHWGNSGDPNMYHDPQTRRNGISYRSNMIRTVQELIQEDQPEKAKDILDLAMEKMPVQQFGFYSILSPIIASYYKIGETEKAREVWKEVATIYQQNLDYYAQLSKYDQDRTVSEIIENMQRYRDLVDIVIMNEDEDKAKDTAAAYNDYIDKFPAFMDNTEDLEYEEDSIEDIKDQIEDSTDGLSLPQTEATEPE